jgi:Fe-S-cluster containining protein
MTAPLPEIPPLRNELLLRRDAEGRAFIDETCHERRIRLDERGAAVIALLDRPQSEQELLERISSTTGKPMEPDSLRRVLEAFDRLGLLDTLDTRATVDSRNEALADLAAEPDSIPLLIPEDLRFSCTACGSCCRGVNIPVSPVTARMLTPERRTILQKELVVRRGLFFSMIIEDEERELTLCQTRNGACVFLEESRCALHRRWGSQAKPHVCQAFPFQFVLTPQGIAVGLQAECRDLLQATQGRPVRDQEDDLRSIMSHAIQIPTVPAFVPIDDTLVITAAEYDGVEARVLDDLGKVDAGGYRLHVAAGRRIRDAIVANGGSLPDPRHDPEELRDDFHSTMQAISESLLGLTLNMQCGGDGIVFRRDNLDAVLACISEMPLFADQVLGDDEAGDAHRLASMTIRNTWQSKDMAIAPNLSWAAALGAFRWMMARALAVRHARKVGREFLDSRDLLDGWVQAHMLLRNNRVNKALKPFRPALTRLFLHDLEGLIAVRNRMVEIEPRLEFHLF